MRPIPRPSQRLSRAAKDAQFLYAAHAQTTSPLTYEPTIKHFGWSTHVSKAKFYGCGKNAFLGQEIFVLSNHSAALQLCTAYKSSCSVRGCQFSSENLQFSSATELFRRHATNFEQSENHTKARQWSKRSSTLTAYLEVSNFLQSNLPKPEL